MEMMMVNAKQDHCILVSSVCCYSLYCTSSEHNFVTSKWNAFCYLADVLSLAFLQNIPSRMFHPIVCNTFFTRISGYVRLSVAHTTAILAASHETIDNNNKNYNIKNKKMTP